MGAKIEVGRIKPKKESTFSKIKKPFKGKDKNRKGSTKNSFLTSEVKSNRIKPKYKAAGGGVRKEGIKDTKAVRFSAEKLHARVLAISELGACQVCDRSYDLDYPHHVVQGLGFKDDRYMINICLECHALIHSVTGYDGVAKSKEECKGIAWSNHLLFEEKEEL